MRFNSPADTMQAALAVVMSVHLTIGVLLLLSILLSGCVSETPRYTDWEVGCTEDCLSPEFSEQEQFCRGYTLREQDLLDMQECVSYGHKE